MLVIITKCRLESSIISSKAISENEKDKVECEAGNLFKNFSSI